MCGQRASGEVSLTRSAVLDLRCLLALTRRGPCYLLDSDEKDLDKLRRTVVVDPSCRQIRREALHTCIRTHLPLAMQVRLHHDGVSFLARCIIERSGTDLNPLL